MVVPITNILLSGFNNNSDSSNLLIQWGVINTVHHDFWVQFPVSYYQCFAMATSGDYTWNGTNNWIYGWDWYQFHVCRSYADLTFSWISIGVI